MEPLNQREIPSRQLKKAATTLQEIRTSNDDKQKHCSKRPFCEVSHSYYLAPLTHLSQAFMKENLMRLGLESPALKSQSELACWINSLPEMQTEFKTASTVQQADARREFSRP